MKYSIFISVLLTSICLASSAFPQGNSWKPAERSVLSFQSVVAAKVYEDKGTSVLGLILFKEMPEQHTMKGEKNETRTRTVTDPKTGKSVVQEYTVKVPYAMEIERIKIVSERLEVPLTASKVWATGGKLLSSEEVVANLAAPRRCFLIRGSRYTRDPFFAEMLKDDVYVLWFDRSKVTAISKTGQKLDVGAKVKFSELEQKFLELCTSRGKSNGSLKTEGAFLGGIAKRTNGDFIRYHDEFFVEKFKVTKSDKYLELTENFFKAHERVNNYSEDQLKRLKQRGISKEDLAISQVLNAANTMTRQVIHCVALRLKGELNNELETRYKQTLEKMISFLENLPNTGQ